MNQRYLIKAFAIIFITSLLFFFEFGLNNIYNSLGSSIVSEFNLNSTEVGFVASLFFYTDLVFLIPAGVIVDRYSPRYIITTVIICSSSGTLLTAVAHSLTMLIISRLLMGFGGGFCFVGCIRIAVNWFPSQYLARISGFIVTMGMLGGFMVQTPLTLLIHAIGWRDALWVITFIGYSIAALIYIFVRDIPQERKEEIQGHVNKHFELGIFKCVKLALLKKQNWLCGLYTSLMNLPIFMLGALWGIPYLTQVNNFSVTDAATISGMLYIGTMIGSPSLGWFSDIISNRKRPMQIGAIISIILIFIIMQISSNNFWLMIFLFLALGFITSTQVISYPTVIESNPKTISSSCTCVISMMCMGGGMLIQPLFGYMLAFKGGAKVMAGTMSYPAANYEFAMYALPLAFLIALILTFFIKETKGQSIVE